MKLFVGVVSKQFCWGIRGLTGFPCKSVPQGDYCPFNLTIPQMKPETYFRNVSINEYWLPYKHVFVTGVWQEYKNIWWTFCGLAEEMRYRCSFFGLPHNFHWLSYYAYNEMWYIRQSRNPYQNCGTLKYDQTTFFFKI